ncbi:methyl-CpG-binding domain protein 1b isoform X2 [Rhinichthys klamathensis goyatoka]|uniref:methyl-CpG-binding domain protein 1b isoform X2 n=1 Tax=Rhinichthys klamathensis goyatoka TaxID=3034132 RepID=UPI0024B52F6D|nr:methyl-CpG-binding domain protein 1b isoform X2 [Rhinichthys klamathensis goyatoka]
METEEVAAEAPAEPTAEVKDANTEENKEPVPTEPTSEAKDANTEENKEPVPAEPTSEGKDANTEENKEPVPAEPTSEGKDANTEENKEPVPAEPTSEGKDANTEENKETVPAEPTSEGKDANTEENKEPVPGEPTSEGKDANTEENKEPTTSTDIQDHVTEEAVPEIEGESSKDVDKPPCDWLEPLEEDCEDFDSQSVDGEIESLAGSEWSGSVVSVLKTAGERGGRGGGRPRRRTQLEIDEGWEDCPPLGKGWKRKQVFRRSGNSEGRSDTYYISPRGHKVRSRVELMKHINDSVDLTNFDFKTGQFLGDGPRRRKKRRVDSPMAHHGGSSTPGFPNELTNAGGTACSPGSSASLSCGTVPKLSTNSTQKAANTVTPPKCSTFTGPGTNTTLPNAAARPPVDLAGFAPNPTVPPLAGSVSADMPINGTGGARQSLFGICLRCNKTFTFEEGQTMCQNCRQEVNASIARRRKPYKKWNPCGRCRACQTAVDCGKCVSCRNGRLRLRLNIHSRKVVKCRKRKCLHPIRKDKGVKISEVQFSKTAGSLSTASYISKPSVSEEFEDSQSSYLQYSDSEDLSMFFGGNDGDNGLDEMGVPKVRRRSCGKCKGCVRRTDCGSCDFCMDKPKFGGRNKKRQKCRLRQCQREAMKHLLPMDEAEMLFAQGWVTRGRPRYTYGRGRPRSKKLWDFEVSDNEAEQYVPKASSGAGRMAYVYTDVPNSHMMNNIPLYNPQRIEMRSPQLHAGRAEMIKENGLQGSVISSRAFLSVRPEVLSAARWNTAAIPPGCAVESLREGNRSQGSAGQEPCQEEQYEGESCPSITQIFSMADSDPTIQGIDINHELMPLLKSLRSMVLPVLWFCVVVEGPRLQLMQCSKRSTMADTIVHIEPSFHYHISVQGQPLLPTHKLYDSHPSRLTTTEEVVALLEELERYSVCQGSGHKDSAKAPEPVLPERAATCDFLIFPEAECCEKCKTPQKV